MYIPPGLMTHLNAEALECGRPGEDDPTAPTLPQYQPSQMNKPFVLDGARQQPRRQCRGGAWPKRTQPQPILQLSGMAPAVPLDSQILVDGFGKNVVVRHYTLSDADITAIQRCRGDHNRLGHALMLCYLRYPGRPLHPGERPPVHSESGGGRTGSGAVAVHEGQCGV